MQTLRCGIIGCGVIAPTHVQSYQLQAGVEVVWACDLVEEKAQNLAQRYGINGIATDYRELLADPKVDCISICTDHASHSPIAVDALNSGKHVLCEKALAATRGGLARMLTAHAQYPDLVFSGVFQHRFDSVNRAVRRLVAEGVFGQILTAGVQMRCLRTHNYYTADKWRGTWAEEGGAVLINQAIHYIDQLVWIMGPVVTLAGTYANLTHAGVMETEDTAAALLRFSNGAIGTIEATCSSHLGWEPTLAIHGTDGSIELRNDRVLKMTFDDKAVEQRVIEELDSCRANPGVDAGKGYYGTGHPAQIADFVEAVRGSRPPFVTAASAKETVEVVLAIYESQHSGQWVVPHSRQD